MPITLRALIVIGVAASAFFGASAAEATFPGANGKIAFATDRDDPFGGGTYEIYTMNADGTGQMRLTHNPSLEAAPAWSPDGTKIAFARSGDVYTMNADGTGETRLTNDTLPDHRPVWSPDGTKIALGRFFSTGGPGSNDEIYTMNSDGTGLTRLTNNAAFDGGPAWSPDGTKIAFVRLVSMPGTDSSYEIYTMNADGTGETRLTNNTIDDTSPDWSADGHKIAFTRKVQVGTRNGIPVYSFEIYTMNADGSGQTQITPGPSDSSPAWSPDGAKIAFGSLRDNGYGEIYTMNADGTNVDRLTNNAAFDVAPAWQPIPLYYPRPRGATPTYAPLVPAYAECTTPNTTHGGPLSFPSCAPPTQTSPNVTIGSPDANATAANSTGWVRLDVVTGNPGTPADEADVKVTANITDVRCYYNSGASFCVNPNIRLHDYGGELQAKLQLRITDRDNMPDPGGSGPGTVQDSPFAFSLPCSATAADNIGSTCAAATTVDAIVPGAVKESRRSIWQLGRIEVYDGGTDGLASTTADNTLFLDQGVFVP